MTLVDGRNRHLVQQQFHHFLFYLIFLLTVGRLLITRPPADKWVTSVVVTSSGWIVSTRHRRGRFSGKIRTVPPIRRVASCPTASGTAGESDPEFVVSSFSLEFIPLSRSTCPVSPTGGTCGPFIHENCHVTTKQPMIYFFKK